MDISKQYKEARKRRGVTLGALSRRTKISIRTIQRFENESADIGYKKLVLLCEAIEMSKINLKKEED